MKEFKTNEEIVQFMKDFDKELGEFYKKIDGLPKFLRNVIYKNLPDNLIDFGLEDSEYENIQDFKKYEDYYEIDFKTSWEVIPFSYLKPDYFLSLEIEIHKNIPDYVYEYIYKEYEKCDEHKNNILDATIYLTNRLRSL